jgi:hypothetical protein
MTKQFENPVENKVEENASTGTSAQKRIDKVAQELAVKPSKTIKNFDQENSKPFSK